MSLRKSIYVIGPSSVGKTTIARELSTRYSPKPHMITEVARNVIRTGGYDPAGDLRNLESGRFFEFQRDILHAQYVAEEEASGHYISDRSGVDPIMYTMKYIGLQAAADLVAMPEWAQMRERYSREDAVVVVVEPNEKFLQEDGTRLLIDGLKDCQEFSEVFKTFLREQNIPYKELKGEIADINERVRIVMTWAQTEPAN